MQHIPALHNLARGIETEDVDSGIVMVAGPVPAAVQDDEVILGDDPLELNSLVWVVGRQGPLQSTPAVAGKLGWMSLISLLRIQNKNRRLISGHVRLSDGPVSLFLGVNLHHLSIRRADVEHKAAVRVGG